MVTKRKAVEIYILHLLTCTEFSSRKNNHINQLRMVVHQFFLFVCFPFSISKTRRLQLRVLPWHRQDSDLPGPYGSIHRRRQGRVPLSQSPYPLLLPPLHSWLEKWSKQENLIRERANILTRTGDSVRDKNVTAREKGSQHTN